VRVVTDPTTRFGPPLLLLVAGAIAVSLAERAPDGLPGVALGSTVLLHAERAAALFAIVVGVVSVLREATRGRLPTQLSTSGLGYADPVPPGTSVEALEERVDWLTERVGRLEAPGSRHRQV
jgi:hypothetical protein